jgi:hypothetical protein
MAGEVYALKPPSRPGETWNEQVIADFSPFGTIGSNPLTLIARNGIIYGTTEYGGSASNWGVVYSLTRKRVGPGTCKPSTTSRTRPLAESLPVT